MGEPAVVCRIDDHYRRRTGPGTPDQGGDLRGLAGPHASPQAEPLSRLRRSGRLPVRATKATLTRGRPWERAPGTAIPRDRIGAACDSIVRPIVADDPSA